MDARLSAHGTRTYAALHDGLAEERGQPRSAHRAFTEAVRGCERSSGALTLVAVVACVAMATVAYLIGPASGALAAPLAFALLLVAVVPLLALGVRREAAHRGVEMKRRWSVWSVVIRTVGTLFGEVLNVLGAALIAAVALLPVGLLALGAVAAYDLFAGSSSGAAGQLSGTAAWSVVSGVVFAYALVLTLADASSYRIMLVPWHSFAEALVGLRERRDHVLQFVVFVALIALVAGGGELGLVYERYWEALLVAVVTGVFLGLGLITEEDDRLLVLARLGQIRCDLAMGRIDAARWRINALGMQASGPWLWAWRFSTRRGPGVSTAWLEEAMHVLAGALYEQILRRSPFGLRAMSADEWYERHGYRDRDPPSSSLASDLWATGLADSFGPYREAWLASVENTRALAMPERDGAGGTVDLTLKQGSSRPTR